MVKLKQAIVVEGKYDQNTLSQLVDATIFQTRGFGVMHDKALLELLRKAARTTGLIIFTDSDGAGFVIRNYIRGCVDPKLVKHAYIPDIYGKERRKSAPSREGKLGVEGMKPQVLLDALIRAGATFDDEENKKTAPRISKADMYARGLSGREGSAEKRAQLIKQLGLPERLTADGLLDVLNATMSREEFLSIQT